ncbi:hypothetical protein K3495_g12402 [Podosphaera aphanis]|nr:hypothetical protein K3495_g12402 [Podosphaera aphanis]
MLFIVVVPPAVLGWAIVDQEPPVRDPATTHGAISDAKVPRDQLNDILAPEHSCWYVVLN